MYIFLKTIDWYYFVFHYLIYQSMELRIEYELLLHSLFPTKVSFEVQYYNVWVRPKFQNEKRYIAIHAID